MKKIINRKAYKQLFLLLSIVTITLFSAYLVSAEFGYNSNDFILSKQTISGGSVTNNYYNNTYNSTNFYNVTYATWAYNMSDGSYNVTYSVWAYNMTIFNNSIYNDTYNKWAYNMTIYNNSFYNDTYNIWTYNQTSAGSTLYADIKWGYNMTSTSSGSYNSTYDKYAYNQTAAVKIPMNFYAGMDSGYANFLGAGATLTPVGLAAFTATGTPAASPSTPNFSTKERWVVVPSAATINTGAGYQSTAFTEGRFEYLPRLITKIAMDDSGGLYGQNRTMWVALANMTMINHTGVEATANVRGEYIGIRFANRTNPISGASIDDQTWQCCSSNITAGSCNAITSAVLSINSTWYVDVGYDSSSQIHCNIWNTTNSYRVTKTDYLPAGNKSYGISDIMTTHSAKIRNFYIEWLYSEWQ